MFPVEHVMNTPSRCPTCKGKKFLACGYCGGRRPNILTCENCNQSGDEEECWRCEGTGITPPWKVYRVTAARVGAALVDALAKAGLAARMRLDGEAVFLEVELEPSPDVWATITRSHGPLAIAPWDPRPESAR